MREADRRAIQEIGIPARVLMENAGREVAAVIRARDPGRLGRRVAVLIGRGSNGGDGLVTARVLLGDDLDVTVFLIGRRADVLGEAQENLECLSRLGGVIIEVADAETWTRHAPAVAAADVIVDALFGTGLGRPLAGLFETVVNSVNAMRTPVVSIDLPSGLSADSHDVPGPAIRADLTVALAAPKIPLVLPPAEDLAGDLVVVDIGIPRSIVSSVSGPHLDLITPGTVRKSLKPRPPDAHKGQVGRIVVVAGSPGKTGAARLAGLAALRSGAGLVTVATPVACQEILSAGEAEYLTLGLPEGPSGGLVQGAIAPILGTPADVLAIGPGLGADPETARVVRELVARRPCAVVLDADGLNAFRDAPDGLGGGSGPDLVITPHPGEMARLIGATTEEVQANRLETARSFAVTHRVTVVLKGHRTLIASPEGHVAVNPTGNPGMASAGMGDVLTGVIAAWMARLDTIAACRLAVYLHGLAGDIAERRLGQSALIASDVVGHLGDATLTLQPPGVAADPGSFFPSI